MRLNGVLIKLVSLIAKIKNHPGLSILIVFVAVLIAIANFTDAVDKIVKFANTYLLRLKAPSFQFQLSDNLYNDKEIKKPGKIVYDGLITLPIAEKVFIKDLFLKINFPIIIKKFELVNETGVEGSKIQFGTEHIIELKEKEGLRCHTRSLNMEIRKAKPGTFFRFKVYSLRLPNRDVNREVHYSGYFYWETNSKTKKESMKGKFSPQFYKIAEIDLKKWRMLSETLSKIDPKQGSLNFWTEDQRWYEKNDFFIDFIPTFKKQDFKIRMFRDRDNVFKCELTTYYYKDVILQFKDIEKLCSKLKYPSHMITVTWSKENNTLYIDDELVDSQPKRH